MYGALFPSDDWSINSEILLGGKKISKELSASTPSPYICRQLFPFSPAPNARDSLQRHWMYKDKLNRKCSLCGMKSPSLAVQWLIERNEEGNKTKSETLINNCWPVFHLLVQDFPQPRWWRARVSFWCEGGLCAARLYGHAGMIRSRYPTDKAICTVSYQRLYHLIIPRTKPPFEVIQLNKKPCGASK